MLTPEQTDGLQDAFQRLTEPLTEYLVSDIARRVSQAGQLTSTAAYQIWKLQKLGKSRDEVERQVGELLGKELEEVQTLFRQAAEVGYNFDISHLPRDALAFADNTVAQQIVEAAVKLAQEDLTNLVQTIGFVGEDGVARELTSAYRHATDTAFTQVVSGGTDYNTALRRACAQLVQQGIRTIDYESGVHTSLEAAVRRNLMGGLGLMVEEISQENHDALGADGWEISAHAMSAPDHEPFQGKQYSDEDYARLNASLHRRIGTLNCGHNAFPILLGISQPQYTSQELEQFRSDNEAGVMVDGRHYTGYEATQKQRQIERAIRTQKRRVLVEEAGGDKERLSAAQIRLQRLRQEYRRFSNAAGLRTEEERLMVAGFGRRGATKNRKLVARYSGIRYNKDGTVIVTDDWTGNEHPRLPSQYLPYAVVDTLSQNGRQRDRMYYDGEGRQIKQISSGPHGNLKKHPYGTHGEHAHDILWENGKIVGRTVRELSQQERKENADLL
ncbi:phage minor capsid protein [Pseudoflavonifractor phocaeensis]|uniref:phage minor capsid protein n=1 Tax=Pseudoflavonifractor phocaeensis TaxID=1870988 RepID=UPI001958D166|nr:phage minor capsid protein [Pseudoflavonifractor phocaeensis]MBM6938474.1 phage minor capsid protein [Pseudoflavonifractor phocaeensis]